MKIVNNITTDIAAHPRLQRASTLEAGAAAKIDSYVPGTGPDDCLKVGNQRWMVGEQVADVEFHYIDGSTVRMPDGAAVKEQLARTKDGTLDWARTAGHGGDRAAGASMGLDVNDEGAAGLSCLKGTRTPRLMLEVSDGKRNRQEDLGRLMEGKWAPGGQRLFRLDACDTGNAHGLAEVGARALPGIRFQGVSGALWENPITGAERPAAGLDAYRQFVVPRSQAGQYPGALNAFPGNGK